MRKAIALCCLLLLLAGCTGAPKNADADPTPAPPASDTPTASAAASSPQPVRELYRITVGTENIPIYDGPGYQCTLVDRISTPGVYTIVEETRDAEGNLWGKLKSGIGWIHVAYMNTDVAGVAPIVLDYADEDLIAGGHFYACGNSGARGGVLFVQPLYGVHLAGCAVWHACNPHRCRRCTSVAPRSVADTDPHGAGKHLDRTARIGVWVRL